MLAKVWRDNKFTGTEGRVSGNHCRGFCQVCYQVRFTACRGESLLKANEKISVGWSVQRYSSFEIVIVRPLQRSLTSSPCLKAEDSSSSRTTFLLRRGLPSLVPFRFGLTASPQAFGPIPQALRYGLSLLCIARHGSRRAAHRKRRVRWFNTVMFLPLTLRQRTHRNVIQLSRYCSTV